MHNTLVYGIISVKNWADKKAKNSYNCAIESFKIEHADLYEQKRMLENLNCLPAL